MSKENNQLAAKIVEQCAVIHDIDAVETTPKPTKKDPGAKVEKKVEAHAIEIPVIGYTHQTYNGTVAECKKQMANQLASDLEDGALVLSDTWADDNLGKAS